MKNDLEEVAAVGIDVYYRSEEKLMTDTDSEIEFLERRNMDELSLM